MNRPYDLHVAPKMVKIKFTFFSCHSISVFRCILVALIEMNAQLLNGGI